MKSSELHLGEYVFDKEKRRLARRDGQPVNLRHKSLEVLVFLANNTERTVLKHEFFDTVWEGAHVSDESIAKCISDIRKSIDDRDKRILVTVPRKGYKLVLGAHSDRIWPGYKYALFTVFLLMIGITALLSNRHRVSEIDRPVVAVRYFKNLSSEPRRDYLSDAISEGLIVNLARYPEFVVISENSSFQFRKEPLDVQKASQLLGADFILEGTQQFDGSTIRITAQLIDAITGVHVWTESIDAELGAIFEVNEALSRRVAHAVADEVKEVKTANRSDNEADAMFRFFRARQIIHQKFSREHVEQAKVLNTKNVSDYPDEPWGHIGLSKNLRVLVRFGWIDEPPEKVLERAMNHAQLAVKLAPQNYMSRLALGQVLMQSGDQNRAIQELTTAIGLNPSASITLNALALAYFFLGSTDKSLEALAKAEVVDPLGDYVHHWMKAWALWQDRQCEAALASLNRIPEFPTETYKLLTVIHVCRGDTGAANEALAPFMSSHSDWSITKERAQYALIWRHTQSLDRWLSALSAAGMPQD